MSLGNSNSSDVRTYLLHIAAESGKVKKLERLLKDGQILETDSKGRTPLHFACEFAYHETSLRMVGVILNSLRDETAAGWKRFTKMVSFLNVQDNQGETALHIAAKIGHTDVVKQLLLHGADQHVRDKMLRTPLDMIYCNMPTAIIPYLDASIKSNGRDLYNDKLQLTFDFSSVIGKRDPESSYYLHRETKSIANCLKQDVEKRSEILSHPVVQAFIHLKWAKIKRILFLSLIFHSFWLILYTTIICQLYLFTCHGERVLAIRNSLNVTAFSYTKVCENGHVEARSTSTVTNEVHSITPGVGHKPQLNHKQEIPLNSPQSGINCDLGPSFAAFYVFECIILFGCTVAVIIKKGYQFYVSPSKKYYFSKIDNIGQLLLICLMPFTFITAFTMKDNHIQFTAGSMQCIPEVFGILIAWSLILKQLGKFSRLGIYVEILGYILKRFVEYIQLFAPLLLAFAISFLILMPQNEEFDNVWVFLKVFVMMTGEIEYRETFYAKDSPSTVPFANFTKVVYALFVAVVTMVFFNLLIGLTVSDIQDLQRQAKFNELARKLEQMDNTERIIFSKRLQKFGIGHLLKYFVVTQQLPDGKTNLQVDISINEIPSDLRHLVRGLAVPNLKETVSESEDDEDESNCVSQACDLLLVRHSSKKHLHRFTFRN